MLQKVDISKLRKVEVPGIKYMSVYVGKIGGKIVRYSSANRNILVKR
ncbi:hypothetical protein ES708_04359 [subsurface metagenome]